MNPIDKYFKDRLDSDQFEVVESDWLAAKKMLDHDKRRKKVGFWIWGSGMAAILLVAAGLYWIVDFGGIDSPIASTQLPQKISIKTEAQISNSSATKEIEDNNQTNDSVVDYEVDLGEQVISTLKDDIKISKISKATGINEWPLEDDNNNSINHSETPISLAVPTTGIGEKQISSDSRGIVPSTRLYTGLARINKLPISRLLNSLTLPKLHLLSESKTEYNRMLHVNFGAYGQYGIQQAESGWSNHSVAGGLYGNLLTSSGLGLFIGAGINYMNIDVLQEDNQLSAPEPSSPGQSMGVDPDLFITRNMTPSKILYAQVIIQPRFNLGRSYIGLGMIGNRMMNVVYNSDDQSFNDIDIDLNMADPNNQRGVSIWVDEEPISAWFNQINVQYGYSITNKLKVTVAGYYSLNQQLKPQYISNLRSDSRYSFFVGSEYIF